MARQAGSMISSSSEQLLAVAEEISALTRCGTPLEQGLVALGSDLPGKTGRLIQQLGEDVTDGTPIDQAIAARDEFPDLFAAAIRAGLRTGNLSDVVNRLAVAVRNAVNLRKQMRLAMIYPAFVVALAYGLFLYAIYQVFPVTADVFAAPESQDSSWTLVSWLRTTADLWWWLPPLMGMALFAAAWRNPNLLPGARRLRKAFHATHVAIFAEVLSLLVTHDEPLDSAVMAAAESTGQPQLIEDARQWADEIQRGTPASTSPPQRNQRNRTLGVPPLLRWSLGVAENQQRSSEVLRRAAISYRRQAEAAHQWCEVYLPLVLVLCVAGSATIAYVMAMAVPWMGILKKLIEFSYGPA